MPQATLGRLQTGTAGSLEFAAYSFDGGLNVQDVPEQVGDDDLVQAYNGYINFSGGFQSRNGMTTRGSSLGSNAYQGLARFYQTVRNGSAVVPIATAVLGESAGVLYNVDTSANLGSIGGGSAKPWTYVRACDPNDPNYGSGKTDVIIICTGSGGPYVWDGANLYTPAGWASAAGARWCALVNGIVWFGGIATAPNTIYGTGDGTTLDASMETLPAYRVFVMSQPVTGLCALGTGANSALVIGMNRGISTLSGTGASNYYLSDIPSDDGVMAGRTMVSDEGVFYYLGRQAVYACDGQSPPVPVSAKVQPWILNSVLTTGYPMTGDRSSYWAQIYNDKLHVGYISSAATLNTILAYDLVVKGWTVQQSSPGLSCMCLLDAPGDASPAAAVVGSATTGQAYNWDIAPAAGAVATDAGTAILSIFQTKYFKLGVPGTLKSLTRLYPEFFISGPLQGSLFVLADYGQTFTSNIVAVTNSQLGWGTGLWGGFNWQQAQPFFVYGPPQSRNDFSGIQAESFAFGFSSQPQSAPWIFGGMTGVFSQRGRT